MFFISSIGWLLVSGLLGCWVSRLLGCFSPSNSATEQPSYLHLNFPGFQDRVAGLFLPQQPSNRATQLSSSQLSRFPGPGRWVVSPQQLSNRATGNLHLNHPSLAFSNG